MTRLNKKHALFIAVFILFLYAFIAAMPVSEEMVLSLDWINSLEADYKEQVQNNELVIPFELDNYFGYVSQAGDFSVKRIKKSDISLSDNFWAEFNAQDEDITVKNPYNETVFNIKNGSGYPFFLDERCFIMHQEQSSVSQLSIAAGGDVSMPENVAWTYDFASPVTCVDAAAGFFLAGTLDGTIELLDGNGRRIYFSETSGSRIAAIYGCALSKDGKKIALVSGLDKQRFVLLEQFGLTWRVTFHEFLEEGLRYNVFVTFVDNDNKIIFERESGLGIYDIKSRSSYKIPLDGEIDMLDVNGDDGMVFLITSKNQDKKNLICVKFPDTVIMEAPFKTNRVFLARRSSNLFVGGKAKLASFKIEKK
jgi:hypothetical protein